MKRAWMEVGFEYLRDFAPGFAPQAQPHTAEDFEALRRALLLPDGFKIVFCMPRPNDVFMLEVESPKFPEWGGSHVQPMPELRAFYRMVEGRPRLDAWFVTSAEGKTLAYWRADRSRGGA